MRKDSVIFQATVQLSVFCPAVEGLQVHVSPAEGQVAEALFTVLSEVERVKLFGLHEAEVRRAKLALLAEYEEAYIERDQTDSNSHAVELVTAFLDAVPAPGIEFEGRMARAILA